MKIEISVWGAQQKGKRISSDSLQVYINPERSGLDAAIAQIERRTRCRVCCVSPQGTSLRNGKPETNHYELTLGSSDRYSDGYNVEGSLWIAVPVGTGSGDVGYRG